MESIPIKKFSVPSSKQRSPSEIFLSGHQDPTVSPSPPQSSWFAIVSFHSKPAIAQSYGRVLPSRSLSTLSTSRKGKKSSSDIDFFMGSYYIICYKVAKGDISLSNTIQ